MLSHNNRLIILCLLLVTIIILTSIALYKTSKERYADPVIPETSSISTTPLRVSSSASKTEIDRLNALLSTNQDCELSTGNWSDCFIDPEDNKYKKSRTNTVLKYPRGNGKQCGPLVEVEDCNSTDCQVSQWTEYSNCFKDTDGITADSLNKYIQVRTRSVTTPPSGKGAQCGDLFEVKQCQSSDCTIAETTESEAPWTKCAPSDSDPTKYERLRQKFKVTAPPKAGGSCKTAEELIERQVCNPNDCEVEDWNASSTETSGCYRNDQGQYVKLQKRKIKTDAKNGGSCNVELTRELPCDPINCEYNDWANPTSCYLNENNEWERMKSRTIKTSARYGGVECKEEDLLQVEKCADKDCEILSDWKDYSTKCYTKADGTQAKLQYRDFNDAINNGRKCVESDYIREVNC